MALRSFGILTRPLIHVLHFATVSSRKDCGDDLGFVLEDLWRFVVEVVLTAFPHMPFEGALQSWHPSPPTACFFGYPRM